MSTLLYHPPDNPVEESPFDRAILELAIGNNVKIVSPYISLGYLERIIGVSQSWRLISDVLEWLSATPSRERDAVFRFLERHEGLIHHYPAIHAKVVISPAAAYTGSANLTNTGVLRRTEFGVLLREKAQIDEIHQWFTALWAQTSPPSLSGVQKLISSLNQLSAPDEDTLSVKETYLESNAHKVRARLIKVLGEHPVSIAARLAERYRVEIPSATATTSELSKKALQIRAPAKESEGFDLEAAVSTFIEKHAALGFSFAELHSALMGLSSSLRMRDTYFSVLNYCASHPRSIFSEEALNRLVYRQGRFLQSSKVHLEDALAPIDGFLAWLIKSLSFAEQRLLPERPPAEIKYRIRPATYRLLLSALSARGFIHLEEGAILNEQAVWSSRLRLLVKAHQAWQSTLAKCLVQRKAVHYTLESSIARSITSSPGLVKDLEDLTSANYSDKEFEENSLIDERKRAKESIIERLDIVFETLVLRYTQEGDVLKTSLPILVEHLAKASGLKTNEVEQALNGSSPYIQSPFMVLPTASRQVQVKIFPLLQDNSDLPRLQKTMKRVLLSNQLKNLTKPQSAQEIPTGIKNSAERTKPIKASPALISDEKADKFYRIFTDKIYRASESTLRFGNLKALIKFLSSDSSNYELVRRFICGSIPKNLEMYRLEYSKTFAVLSVSYENLQRFPTTKAYLEGVVWRQEKIHSWLPQRLCDEPLSNKSYEGSVSQLAKVKSRRNPDEDSVSQLAEVKSRLKQSDALFAQLLQLAITHGNPLPPNRLTGLISDIQQQADKILRKVNKLCLQYPETVRPVITLQRPLERPAYIDVVLRVEHEDDLSFLPMTAKLLLSPHLRIKRV